MTDPTIVAETNILSAEQDAPATQVTVEQAAGTELNAQTLAGNVTVEQALDATVALFAQLDTPSINQVIQRLRATFGG